MAHLNDSLRTSLDVIKKACFIQPQTSPFYEINIETTFLTFANTLPCDSGNIDQSTDYYIGNSVEKLNYSDQAATTHSNMLLVVVFRTM
jgi:hypothetical protein